MGPAPDGWKLWIDEPAAKKSWFRRHKILTGVGAFLILCFVGAAASGDGSTTEAASATTVPTTTSSQTAFGNSVDPKVAEAAKATAAAEAKAKADAAAKAKEAAAARDPKSFKALTTRAYALVAKNPDDYVGKKFVIYGRVSQFDAATGNDSFLADTGAKKYVSDWYQYDVNTMITGDAADLKSIVEDDIVQMYVVGDGSYSYDTQMGGNTTVPSFYVVMIKVVGSAK